MTLTAIYAAAVLIILIVVAFGAGFIAGHFFWHHRSPMPQTKAGARQRRILEVYREFSLTEPNRFKVGELVQWKPNLRNKRRPVYGEPAVVLEVLDTPLQAREHDPGSPYFREHLDVVLGVLDEDGDFFIYHYDSKRFQQFASK